MASSEVIDRIREASDIVSVVEEYFPLRRAGSNYKACCPFHEEKTGSFIVSPAKQIFHCFGCGESGNVFNFIMKMEGLSFIEVLRRLSDRTGIQLDDKYEASARKKSSIKTSLHDLNSQAADFYHSILFSEQGSKALKYLLGRGLDEETIKKFKLGYAPSGNPLLAFLKKATNNEDLIVKAGLAKKNANGQIYDMFRDRVMYPIHDDLGKICGFGGRVMTDEGTPKYLNTAQTEVFEKRKQMYGFFHAKDLIKKTKSALILEGYMDVIAAHQFEAGAAVATLGTALSEEHLKKLKHWVDELIFIFDSDDAGQKAAERGLDIAIMQDMSIKICELPHGMDPEDVIRRDKDEFLKFLAQSRSMFDWRIERSIKKFANISDRSVMQKRVIKDLANVINSVASNALAKHAFIEKLREHFKLAPLAQDALAKEVEKEIKTLTTLSSSSSKPAVKKEKNITKEGRLIKEILHVIIKYPKLKDKVGDILKFKDEDTSMYLKLLADFINVYDTDLHAMLEALNEDEKKLMSAAVMSDLESNISSKEYLHELLKEFDKCRLQKQFEIVSARISKMINQNQPVAKDEKDEYNRLTKALKGI